MEDASIHNSIIIACIAGIIVVSLLIISGTKTEGFTELYFLDYTKVPERESFRLSMPYQTMKQRI